MKRKAFILSLPVLKYYHDLTPVTSQKNNVALRLSIPLPTFHLLHEDRSYLDFRITCEYLHRVYYWGSIG